MSLGLEPFNKRHSHSEQKDSKKGIKSIFNSRSSQGSINECTSKNLVEETKINQRKPLEFYYSAYSYRKNLPSLCDSHDDAPSPRGLARNGESMKKSPPASIKPTSTLAKPEKTLQVQPIKNMDVQVLKPVEISPDTMKIETRRTIICEGGISFEEISTIHFPKDLPSNVQVIAAQFVQSN